MARKKKTQTSVAPEPTSTAVEAVRKEESMAGEVMVALNRAQGIIYRMPDGRKVEIAGNAVHLKGKDMAGSLPVGAYGLTRVKASDWEWISGTYADTALFKSGRIFASDTKAEALSEAGDRAGLRHGLEPVPPKQTKPEDGEESSD